MAKSRQRGVYEHPPGSGTWWIHYYDAEGQRHREKIGRYQAAVDAYMARKMAIREGRYAPPRPAAPEAGIRFNELAALALTDRRQRLAGLSVDADERRAKVLIEWFGKKPAAKVTAGEIGDRLRSLRDQGLTGATANRYKALLSAIFAWGVRLGKIPANPARLIQAYRESEARVRFLEAGEEAAIREVLRRDWPQHETEFDIALHTGMRRNELYRLKWEAVDLQRGIVTVQGKAHANSQKSSRRFIRLNSVAQAAFEKRYARSNGSAWVCGGPHDGTDTDRDYRDWFETAVERAGVDNFRYHDIRHTFASRLVMAGVPLAALMELLGHRSIAMVMRYAHLAPDHQVANIEKLVTEYRPVEVRPIRLAVNADETAISTAIRTATKSNRLSGDGSYVVEK